MNENQDERIQRKQQWAQWQKQKEVSENIESLGMPINAIENNNQNDYLAQLTYKIAERALQQPAKATKEALLEQKVCKEVESNTCAICLELMVPPNYSPILLFPCGHTFCKICTISNGKLKIIKCPLCRTIIKSQAPNISLQNLICAFTNQKHLLQDNQQAGMIKESHDESEYVNLFKMYKMRCEILNEELMGINKEKKHLKDELETQSMVVDNLQAQRNQIKGQMSQLEKQLNQVNSMLQQNLDRVVDIKTSLIQIEDKKLLIDQTLGPLKQEMQKYSVLSQEQ